MNRYVPPKPFRRLPADQPGLCRYCDTPTWLADDDEGPLHPCCEMWASELAAGRPCPSCAAARAGRHKRNR